MIQSQNYFVFFVATQLLMAATTTSAPTLWYHCADSKVPKSMDTVATSQTAADMETTVLSGLLNGVTELPPGPALAQECVVRRSEIFEGVRQVEHTLSDSEWFVEKFARDPKLCSTSELELLADRLECAVGMIRGLRTGAEVLENLDGSKDSTLFPRLRNLERRATDLSSVLQRLIGRNVEVVHEAQDELDVLWGGFKEVYDAFTYVLDTDVAHVFRRFPGMFD